jgi:hypothetical protein
MAKELDDNLMLAVGKLPEVQKREQGVKESIQELGQAIFNSAKVSISSAAKAVVPSIPKAIADITQEIERGSIVNFDKSIEKLNNLVSNLGVNLEDYNKKLADFLKQREEKIVESERKVEELRIQNVVSEVNRITGEVNILSKKEIDEKKSNVEYLSKLIQQEEEKLNQNRKAIQERDDLSDKEIKTRKIFINESTKKIKELTETRQKDIDVIGQPEERPSFGERSGSFAEKYVPAPITDIFMSVKEGFMAPVNAIKELGANVLEFAKPLKVFAKFLQPLVTFMKRMVLVLGRNIKALMLSVGVRIAQLLSNKLLLAGLATAAAAFLGKKAIKKIGEVNRKQTTEDTLLGEEGGVSKKKRELVSGIQTDSQGREIKFGQALSPEDIDERAQISRDGKGEMNKKVKEMYLSRGLDPITGRKMTAEQIRTFRETGGAPQPNTVVNAPTQQVNQNTTNNLPNLDGATNTELWYNRSAQGSF